MARIRLEELIPGIRVYADAQITPTPKPDADGTGQHAKHGPLVCVRATRNAFVKARMAARSIGASAAWSVDGAVRAQTEHELGAAGFACCRHNGSVVRHSVPYTMIIGAGSPVQ
jgi:hypothetical protein